MVPSVAWMEKLKVPTTALPTVTVNAAPPEVGRTGLGEIEQVAGAPDVQESVTLLVEPFTAVSVPFHVTFWLTTVVFGVAVTARLKLGPFTLTCADGLDAWLA